MAVAFVVLATSFLLVCRGGTERGVSFCCEPPSLQAALTVPYQPMKSESWSKVCSAWVCFDLL